MYLTSFVCRKSQIHKAVIIFFANFVPDFETIHLLYMMRKTNIRPFRDHSTAWLTGCCPAGMKEDLRLNEFSEE